MLFPRFNILTGWRMAVAVCGVLLAILALWPFLVYQRITTTPARLPATPTGQAGGRQGAFVPSQEEHPLSSSSSSFSPALLDDVNVFWERREDID